MTAAFILAVIAVPIYLVAMTINLIAFVRLRREHFGPALILLLMAALSLGYTGAYALVASIGVPDLEPPINVVVLRPLVMITGILFTIIPGWLISRYEQHEDVEQVKELLTKAHFRQQQITALEAKLKTTEQLLEMCQTINETLMPRRGADG